MKSYKDLRKRVSTIEFKLGIGYVKTDDTPYKVFRTLNTVAVSFLVIINAITMISFYVNEKHKNIVYVNKPTFILLIIGTVAEIAGIVLNYFGFSIIGNLLNIPPLFYFTSVYMKLLIHPDGLWGYMKDFYLRYAISYVFILIFSAIMLFIAIRQQVKTRILYKRVVDMLYSKYLEEKDGDTLSVNDEEWDDFVKKFDPRKDSI